LTAVLGMTTIRLRCGAAIIEIGANSRAISNCGLPGRSPASAKIALVDAISSV
jgi:hypothetical protein